MLASLLTPYQSDGKYVKVDTYFFERVLSPIYDKVAVLIPRSITPNQITVFGGVLSLTSAYLLTTGHHTAAALVYLGYCTADNLDGKHARATKQCSDWGGILDHCVDGSCSVPATALTWSLFLGLPLVPLMRLIGFTFFVAHVVEAATGELHMGAGSRYVGVDEIGLFVAMGQFAIGQGYKNLIGEQFEQTIGEMAMLLPRLSLITLLMNLKILVDAGSNCDWRKVLLWSPFCVAIFAYPIVEATVVEGVDYDWTAFLMIHAVFFFPLLLITMANGGKLVKAGKEEGSKK